MNPRVLWEHFKCIQALKQWPWNISLRPDIFCIQKKIRLLGNQLSVHNKNHGEKPYYGHFWFWKTFPSLIIHLLTFLLFICIAFAYALNITYKPSLCFRDSYQNVLLSWRRRVGCAGITVYYTKKSRDLNA